MKQTKRLIKQKITDETGFRSYKFSISESEKIRKILDRFGIKIEQSKKIAESILKTSDYYINNPGCTTPWTEDWLQIAYLTYYHHLNRIRALAVHQEGNKIGFFDGIDEFIDFGSGLGSTSSAFGMKNCLCIEDSKKTIELHQELSKREFKYLHNIDPKELKNPNKTIAIFSYSLNELKRLPHWIKELEGVVLIEPSTKKIARTLLNYRSKLQEWGFSIWAPCTHQKKCPLLVHSKKDWCHDRVVVDSPEWFQEIEKHLPVKNRTVTFSYLLCRKKTPPTQQSTAARLIGDLQKQQGKSKQMVCFSEERLFLSWLKKEGNFQEFSRGAKIKISEEHTRVSDEIRLKQDLKLI
jgi:hypothetical protein